MKSQCPSFIRIALAHAFALGLASSHLARAETITITGTQVINQTSVTVSDDLEYKIQNDSLLLFSNTFSQAVSGAAFSVTTSGVTLTIGPAQPGGNGWVIFENYRNNSTSGAVINGNSAARIELSNVIFRNNYVSGATRSGAALLAYRVPVILNNVIFEGNNAGFGGAIRNRVASHGLTMTGGAFTGNYAWGNGYGGAVSNEDSSICNFTDVNFEDNRALAYGGAIAVATGAVRFSNATFTGNWTGSFGGALHVAATATLGFSQSGSVNYYNYTGNFAGGDATPAQTELSSGTANFAAKAKGGGFLYLSAAAARITFNMDSGVTLAIGSAAASDRAHDSIASASGVTGANIFKDGAGDLVLNADNSYYASNITVNGGRLLLGNQNAVLGGKITVNAGATLGGSGIFKTLSQADAELASTITAKNGSFIQVGNGGATDRLAFSGSTTLSAEAGVTFNYTLLENNKTGLLQMGNFQIADTGTINLLTLETGTFDLASWTTTNLPDASGLGLAVNGMDAAPRLNASLGIQGGNTLQLTITSLLYSDNLHWTGSTGNTWQSGGVAFNWLGTTGGGSVRDFHQGDSSVTFDSVADDASPGNRAIAVDAGGVSVADMTVAGTASYTFAGGGIAVTGTLIKAGSGTVTFANAAANVFNTVQLREGEITVAKLEQLGGGLGEVDGDYFGLDGVARVLFTGNVVIDGAGGAAQRLVLSDTAAALGARDAGIVVTDGKTVTVKNALSATGGAAVSVGAGNTFKAGAASPDGTGAIVFQSNTSTATTGGALLQRGVTTLGNAIFADNYSAGQGGAIANDGSDAVLTLNDATFINNTAPAGGALSNSGTINYNITRAGTFASEGNTAAGGGRGGFLDQASASSVFNISVSPGAVVVIGGNDASKDGIAGVAGSRINKTGGGDWVLKSDSSNFSGETTVTQGRLLLGGAGAKISGTVTVSGGATVGGAGEYAGAVSIDGGTLLAGLPGAATAQSLSVANLSLTNSSIDYILHEDGAYALLQLGSLETFTGTGQINVSDFMIGEYTIATGAAADITQLAGLGVTLDGITLGGGRQSLGLLASGSALILKGESGPSCIVTWTGTGAQPGSWDTIQTNWQDTPDGTFANMDKVLFTEEPAGDSHSITIPGSTQISDMEVSGTENYTFTGNGGITARVGQQYGTAFTGAGKLVKRDAGMLSFNNGAANVFHGGIDIYGGIIEFNDGNKLGAGGAAITFKDDATLRATADGGALASNIVIEAGKTATLDTGTHTLVYSGTSSGATGTIAKIGDGTLVYNGVGALGHGNTRVDAGWIKLADITDFGVQHHFFLNGGWVDLSDTNPADPVNDWTNLVFTGSLGGVIGSNDCITLGAGDRRYGIGDPLATGKQGVYVVVDAGAGGVAAMVGPNDYIGSTRLKSGVLQISSDDQLGLVSANREIILDGGGLEITIPDFTTTRPVEVRAAGGSFIVGASATTTLSGVISGNGVLAKDGAGTLVLDAENTHAGTTIRGGAIVMANARALGDGVVSVAGDNTQLVMASPGAVTLANTFELGGRAFTIDTGGSNTTFSGALQGNGVLTLQGGGRATVSGANTLAGLHLGPNTTLVARGVRTLGGRGSNVTTAPGSKIEISTKNTLLNNISIDGGGLVFSNINTLAQGDAMLKVYGSMLLTGSTTITLDSAVGARAYVLIEGPVKLADGATLAFDKGAANTGIEVFHSSGDQNRNLLIAGLDMSTNPGKDIVVSFDSVMAAMNAVHSRLSECFVTPITSHAPSDPKNAFWMKGIGTFASFNGDENRIGFNDNTYGGVVGYDNRLAKNLLAGVFGGYSISRITTTNNAETEIQSPYAGAYAGARMGPIYLSLEGLWGEMDGKTTRLDPQGRAVGTYNANVIGGSVELGGVLNVWDGATIRPSAALNYMNYKYSDQDEIGLGAIFVDDFSKTMVNGSLKVVFSQKFYTLPNKLPGRLDIKIGWSDFLKDDAISTAAGLVVTPGTKFRIIGDEYSNTGCDLGIGLRFALTEKASLGVAYDCNITSDYKRHTVDASMRWLW